LYPDIAQQTEVSIVGELEINEWNGIRKPQIKIEDLRIDEWQLFDYRGRKDSPFVSGWSKGEADLVVCQEASERIPPHINHATFEELPSVRQKVDTLYIMDLPARMEQLEEL